MSSTNRILFAALVSVSMITACSEQVEIVNEAEDAILEQFIDALPNNFPIPNSSGAAATFSTAGVVDLTGPFFVAQGTNGRHCGTCHAAQSGWSIRPIEINLLFALTGGTHPIFNTLDANNPTADVSTPQARRDAYSMLRQGLFRRGSNISASAEYEIIAADDPHGFGNTTRFSFFRRPLATTNLFLITGVMWDDRLTVPGDVHLGLFNQARGNITGGQQGAAPAAELVEQIVTYETELSSAQISVPGVPRLDACGGRGGPELLASQPLVSGRWDLYDAWINLTPGACSSRASDMKRAQIARGQELFNEKQNANGGRCRGCHNAVNNGTNVNGTLFNIHTSDAAYRRPDMPIYTLRNKTTGETVETTDPGKAFVSGRWSDMNRFKAPTLRGLSSRAPYFHNGIARNLEEVVDFYETELGFDFTPQEEIDLVAFLRAL